MRRVLMPEHHTLGNFVLLTRTGLSLLEVVDRPRTAFHLVLGRDDSSSLVDDDDDDDTVSFGALITL
jgi:hypothetical protein